MIDSMVSRLLKFANTSLNHLQCVVKKPCNSTYLRLKNNYLFWDKDFKTDHKQVIKEKSCLRSTQRWTALEGEIWGQNCAFPNR